MKKKNRDFYVFEIKEVGPHPLPRIEKKRICKYPGCKTILRKTNLGSYCSIHSGEYERAKRDCRNFWNEKAERAYEELVKSMVDAGRREELRELDFDYRTIIFSIMNESHVSIADLVKNSGVRISNL